MRGGKREGAGRKKGVYKTNNRKKLSITLPLKLVLWLDGQGVSRSITIENALDNLIDARISKNIREKHRNAKLTTG